MTLLSSKKEAAIVQPLETGSQRLVSVTRTTTLSGNVSYSEAINYEYNNAGKIIAEGNKKYLRDDKQRIVQIADLSAGTNNGGTRVYYSDADENKITYTLCASGDDGRDSVVYLHDSNGRLVKTMDYFSYVSSKYSPDTTFLSRYSVFKYDGNGNIVQVDLFSIDYVNQGVAHCGQDVYSSYDKTINPLYTADEVRTAEHAYYGVINTSINNYACIGPYTKSYEYRTDGRPRSCLVKQNGVEAFKLTFKYN